MVAACADAGPRERELKPCQAGRGHRQKQRRIWGAPEARHAIRRSPGSTALPAIPLHQPSPHCLACHQVALDGTTLTLQLIPGIVLAQLGVIRG